MDACTRAENFVELLAERASVHPERVALRFLTDGESASEVLTYKELHERACAIAARLQSLAPAGERALLLYPSSADYVTAFLGCLYAGMIAVPAYPPESMQQQQLARLMAVIRDAAPRFILTERGLLEPLRSLGQHVPRASSIELVSTDDIPTSDATAWRMPSLREGSIAFLQYTSGSTSAPKGVMVGHDNLIANERSIREAFMMDDSDVVVSWLPLFHDMGLIGTLLQPLFSGLSMVLMAPQRFIERPIRWLQAISTYGGSVSGGPDFAYRLCVERIKPGMLDGLDLRSWRLAFSGAEPVRASTLRAFSERFAGVGFDARALYPCYGLAEATLIVAGVRRGDGVTSTSFDARGLAKDVAIPADGEREIVACGKAQSLHEIVIVEPDTGRALEPGRIGEIQVSGPSVAHGYWQNADATQRTFTSREGRVYLRTGDLGFQHEGSLFITGRLKDLIIVRGHNLYPQDLERTVEDQVEVVRAGRVAAFSVEVDGQEGIGIAAEVSRRAQKLIQPEAVCRAINEAVAQEHGEAVSVVLLLNPGSLPITSSGKLRRAACRAGWEKSSLDAFAVYERGSVRGMTGGAGEVVAGTADVQSETERRLSDIWRDVLKAPVVRSDDTLFSLGGNSLSAAQMLARINEAFGVQVALRALFEAPSLKALARVIERYRAEGRQSGPEPIPRVERDGRMPLSHGERRLWFLWQLDPKSTAYTVAGALRLSGELDVHFVKRAFQTIVARHETLRTTFRQDEGRAYRVIGDAAELDVPVVDLQHEPAGERAALARALLTRELEDGFDLERGPLVRVKLLRLTEREHVLLTVVHHIVSDGWSMNVLAREFVDLYGAYQSRREPELPSLSVQYADYAVWQRTWLESGELERQLAYWKRRLGDEHPVLELSPRPRPPALSHRGATIRFEIDARVAARLRELALARNATLFMVLLSAFKVLLARHSGQTEVRVGVPSANRSRLETERLIGFFVNTHVLRTHVHGGVRFDLLLEQVKEAWLGAEAHQDVPFEKLVEALNPERSLSHNPLFQVMFNHQRLDDAALGELAGLRIERLERPDTATQFDLSLDTLEEGDRLKGTVTYSTDLFHHDEVARMVQRWMHLLQAIGEDPAARVGQLSMLGESERSDVLVKWNATRLEYPRDRCLHELIEEQAGRSPRAVAVSYEDDVLSYTELNARANQLARKLRELGVGPDSLVGIHMERSLDLVVGLLGILKAGGAYVPLDPEYPADRLAYMVKEARPKVVLTQERLLGEVPTSGALAWCVDRDFREVAGYGAENLASVTHPENLAYCIYTSGSTGKPKGVAVCHRGVVNFLSTMKESPGIGSSDCVLGLTSLSFDIAGLELYLPLLVGARIALVGRAVASDAEALLDRVQRQAVTVMQATPATWRMLSQSPGFAAMPRCKVLCGGEALPPDLAKELTRKADRIWNLYGPTETTIWSSRHELDGEDAEPLVGRPVGNTTIFLLNEMMGPVPVGVVGELYIGGDGLARGYLNRPDLTAERFVPNPLGSAAGERLYRTGDLARYREDGVIEYVGRCDHQVKIRGYRIELGEIEARLAAHEAVEEAAVLAREDAPGVKRLVAYVVPGPGLVDSTEGRGPLEAQLRDRLQAELPEYMVPHQYVILDKLPLTANGKLDRKALPAPTASVGQRSFIAPEREIERALAELWAEMLGVERVGMSDDFFELGGHSLLATQVTSRVKKRFDVELPVRALFEARTLAAFVARFEQAASGGATSRQPPLALVDRGQRLPMSYAQQRLWFLWRLSPQSGAYNISAAVRLTGALNLEALESTFTALVARHEALRTRFEEEEGQGYQVIGEASSVQIPVVDLSALPEGEREERARRLVEEDGEKPFDLTCDSLLRVKVLRLAERQHVLAVTVHHIASDGWSMNVLLAEFSRLYGAYSRNVEPDLPSLPIQYVDYAIWQRRWLESGELERQLVYWKGQLGEEHPLLALPTDRPRPAIQSYRGATFRCEIDEALCARLRDLAQERGATLFMVLLSAFSVLLCRYSGQKEVRVGVPSANRNRVEVEPLIGLFVNTHVFQMRVDRAASFEELLERGKEATLGAQANQDVPFERLVDVLNPERSLSHNPLFQVLYNHQKHEHGGFESISGLRVEKLARPSSSTQFDLSLDTTEEGRGLNVALTYSTDLFDGSTIERMARHFRNLLQGIVSGPSVPVGQLPLLDAVERSNALVTWNETQRAYPGERCLHELIEAQVGRTPHAIAVSHEDRALTYAELNARANRLARRLRELGVGPDVMVGVHVERSLEMVVGLLGILKAGGAYVPLDPEYPADRISYMVEDARPKVLLTQDRLAGRGPRTEARVWCLDRDWGEVDAYDAGDLTNLADPGHLAYCIYTSGSTGKPKGVTICHRALVNFLSTMKESPGMQPDDRCLGLTSLSFDIAGLELYLPLIVGARVVLVDRAVASDAEALLERMERDAVTVVQATPATWRMLSQAPRFGALPPCKVLCGGEALPADLADTLVRKAGRVWNVYGPTETTIWSSRHMLDLERPEPLLGRPIGNTEMFVLDEVMNPAPVGVIGDLYIGGDGLARGYLNRPELTADRFVPSPFGRGPGDRLYRTGDLARYRADGVIEYVGRSDHQVKIRGYRIELGEIEARLLDQAGVAAAGVVAREDVPGQKRLVAYVVAAEPGFESAGSAEQDRFREQLRAALRAVLPEYMVPPVIVLLEALPLTANGKLDRKRLPAPDASQAQRDYVAPRSALERSLSEIWGQVLRVERIGVHDNFFELGGDSIIALQVVGKARSAGIQLTPQDVFQHQTLESLASAARVGEPSTALPDTAGGDPSSDGERSVADRLTPSDFPLAGLTQQEIDALPVPARDVEDIFPLSPMQQGLLLHTLLEPGSGIYLMQDHYRLSSGIDPEAFIAAWERVIERHPALRASFVWQFEGKMLQIIHRAVTSPVLYLDWRELSGEEQERRLHELLQEERRRGFDLSRAPLLCIRLIRTGETTYNFVNSYHHILIDDWCRSLLFMNFFTLYQASLEGRRAALPRPPRFRDFIGWLQRQDVDAARRYWREALEGFEAATPLAIDRPVRDGQGFSQIADRFVDLTEEETALLRALSRKRQLTVNSFAQGAWAMLLSQYSGLRDVLFGVTVAGRPAEIANIQDTIGLFINTIPLRVRVPPLSDKVPVADWLRRLQDQNVAMRQYEHLPLLDIQACSVVPYGHALFQSLFVFENAPLDHSLIERRTDFSGNRTHTNYPITVVVVPGRRLRLQISYDQRMFDADDVARMLAHFQRLLMTMARNPDAELGKLPTAAPEEARLLKAWNDTRRDHRLERGFIGLFEEQVARSPDRTAAACEGEALSYGELDRRASRIGHALRRAGVKPGELVAVLAGRGLEMLCMILGVFKAGAAYLALDDKHPAERTAQILRLAGASVVLSDAPHATAIEATVARLSPPRPSILRLESASSADLPERAAAAGAVPRDQLAYVIFTSGSTGAPKGAMVTSQGMLNNQLSKIPFLDLSEDDVIAQTASQSFDISVWQFLAALLFGGRVEIVPDDIARDPVALLEHVQKTGITVLESVPSLIEGMLLQPPVALPRLRWMLPTGEAMPPELARLWFERYPDIPLVNAYGPAECADDVALHRIDGPPPADTLRLPIGRPTDNTRLYVVDAALRPVPVGVTGELCVAGVGVGRGYLGDPAQTAEVFVPDPYAEDAGERLYRTGDLARYRPDGLLEYVGRVDQQVKIRGHRIELGEIEARLVEHDGVRQAAVLVREDAPGEKRLVGYLVRAETAEPEAHAFREQLRTWLKGVLPEYMVPPVYVLLDQLPLNANGKVNRKALPAPDTQDTQKRYVAPRNDLERRLSEIWSEVLGVERVGVHDDFFELGGHSLLAVQIASRVRQRLAIELPLSTLFKATSIASFAEIMEREYDDSDAAAEMAVMSELLEELEQAQ
ncbi:non-ribosomal peptide synthase/polyketide synthase [Sorangium sp. So ce204]